MGECTQIGCGDRDSVLVEPQCSLAFTGGLAFALVPTMGLTMVLMMM